VALLIIYLLIDIALLVPSGETKPGGESDKNGNKFDIIKTAILTAIKNASEHATLAVADITPFTVLDRVWQCEWRNRFSWSTWEIYCEDEHRWSLCVPFIDPRLIGKYEGEGQKKYVEEYGKWESCESERLMHPHKDEIQKIVSKFGLGWVPGVYDGISKVLEKSKYNIIVVLVPLVLGVTFSVLIVLKIMKDFRWLWISPFLGILVASVFSYVLMGMLYVWVWIFDATAGFLIYLQISVFFIIETGVHLRHIVKDIVEVRRELAA
jgi:hypothetical protein